MELTTLLFAIAVFIIVFMWLRKNDNKNLPPFPVKPLPIVGNLFSLSQDSRPLFKKWRKQCGDIYSLYMGNTLVVVLNGYELIKEALIKKADAFSDRPDTFLDTRNGMVNMGLIFSSGSVWKEQRSVSLSILRNFGMGKNLLAEKIQEEVSCFVDFIADLKGKPTDFQVQTNISTSNIICSILIGHRFEYNDKEFQSLILKLKSLVSDQENVSLINFLFWLNYIPGDFFGAKKMIVNMRAIIELLKKFIDEKKRDIDDFSDVCNLIDAYILERNKKVLNGVDTTLDEQNLLKIMMDLFIAGTETTSTTISWCVLYMLHYPEVQEKVYQEIKEKVGTDRQPTIQDRNELIYLNAVIMEAQRLGSIVPLSVTHMCSEEVTIRGYTLPKGTYVLPNLDSVLFNKSTWGEDAMTFKPERFIDDSGKLVIPEQFIPFSIGRRVCLGEALAKMELFLFLSSMFQRYKFLPATTGFVPPLHYYSGIVLGPKPYKVRAVERKCL